MHGLGERFDEIDMSVNMRTTYTWAERFYESSLFIGINFEHSPYNLGGRQKKPPLEGLLMRYRFGKVRILTF